jgi:hypothetical protein
MMPGILAARLIKKSPAGNLPRGLQSTARTNRQAYFTTFSNLTTALSALQAKRRGNLRPKRPENASKNVGHRPFDPPLLQKIDMSTDCIGPLP